jgi:hypothetical protein
MSYIGVPPVTGDFVVLDNITTSATASYTLQRNSANFVPESANHMLVSLNGTIQKPNSSFTISGSTITFSSALTSSDAIDFILVLGNVNAVGVATTVSDNAITNAKTDFVSTSSGAGLQIKGDGTTDGTLQLNCSQNTHGVKIKSPAHSAGQSYTLTLPTTAPSANKALIADGSGNLSFGGNTPAFFAKQGSSQSIGSLSWTKLSIDTEIFDSDSKFDTTTNRFTPTIAGKYFCFGQVNIDSGSQNTLIQIAMYKNGSQAYMHVDRFPSTNDIAVNISVILDLDTDDYVEAYARQSKGSNANILSNSSFFGAYKLIGA